MSCRYPRPCSCDYCMDDIRPAGDAWDTRECYECFAFGRHESYCTKGE